MSSNVALSSEHVNLAMLKKKRNSLPENKSSTCNHRRSTFVNGVTCNSQNVIGLPYLFIGFVDLSLVDFRIFCWFWLSVCSMFSVFIKSVLPF